MFASGLDLVVCGAGPAGLALAAAAADRGLRVACVAPQPDDPWARSFAIWHGELEAFGAHAEVEHTWLDPAVVLADGERVALPEPYVRLSVPALQRSLLAAIARAGVTLHDGSVTAVTHDDATSHVTLASGETLHARLVVDASGPASKLVKRAAHAPLAFQVAYGELVETGPVEMTLMDFRGPALDPPSFLYALPLPGGRAFLEETVLVTRAPVTFDELRARLHARMARLGIARGRVLEEERCLIPLGVGLPLDGERVIAFGASAGMVHPATGYQLARVMAAAPRVAAALSESGTPAQLAARARRACWPSGRERAWSLLTFGMEALASFDLDETRAFLRAFFRLPGATSLSFLRGELSPTAVASAMLRVLFHAAPSTRRRLLRLLFDHHSLITAPAQEIA